MIAVLRDTPVERMVRRERIRRTSNARRRRRKSRRGDHHHMFGALAKRDRPTAKRFIRPFEAPPMLLRAHVMVTVRHALERLAARRALEDATPIAKNRPNPVHLLPVLSASELQRELLESLLG